MKRFYAFAIAGVLFSSLVLAQQPASQFSRSQLELNNTAELLPHLSLAVNAGTSLLSVHDNLFRGSIALGLGDVAEVAFGRTEGVANTLGATQPDLAWALKLKVLSGTQDQPQVALRIQSSVRWISDKLWSQDIQSYSPALYRRGLTESRYDLRLTSIEVLLTHQLFPHIRLHAGVGIQEIQSRDLWITVAPAPLIGNGSHVPDMTQELLLDGFLGLTVPLDSKFTLLSEIQSMPAVSPNIDVIKLNVNRGYAGSLAVRYVLLQALALDGGIVIRANPYTRNDVEIRIGLNTLLHFQ